MLRKHVLRFLLRAHPFSSRFGLRSLRKLCKTPVKQVRNAAKMIARRKTLIRFCVYKRKHVRVHGALIRINFANSRGVLLFEMGFFSRWSSFRDYFCKLKRGASFRDGLLFKMVRGRLGKHTSVREPIYK